MGQISPKYAAALPTGFFGLYTTHLRQPPNHHPFGTEVFTIGVWAIFSRGLSNLCPKNFLTVPEKNCYANWQNYFARLTPPSNR